MKTLRGSTQLSLQGHRRGWLRPAWRVTESGQYTSTQFANLAMDLDVTLSVGRKGQCWDNAVAESFFATVKTELIHHRAWPTRKAATSAIFDYIKGWYNTRRRHSTIGYLSPASYALRHVPACRIFR